MNCPGCYKEVPDNVEMCPHCGTPRTVRTDKSKDVKKEYTHYKIILIKPGPRESTISLIAEITGLSEKQVMQNITNTPWTLVSRLPFDKAQEIKVLLETSRAVVRLEGMDIWGDEDSGNGFDESVQTDKHDQGRKKPKVTYLIVGILISSIALLVYILVTLTPSDGQGLLGGLQSDDVSDIETANPMSIEELESDEDIAEILEEINESIPDPVEIELTVIDLNDHGTNPYFAEIIIRFELTSKEWVKLDIYNREFNKITSLLSGTLEQNSYRITWNGSTDAASQVAPGVYIAVLSTAAKTYHHKIVWLFE